VTAEEQLDEHLRSLLQVDGIGRNVLEARIARMVPVLLAANELVTADDAAQASGSDESGEAEERCERAWKKLREALRTA
jgi:hypothetical protein